MSEDLRTRLTKQMIVDSFVDLLVTKPLNKITVVDICAKAEINRATFYRHYENPYDLFESIENWFIDSMRNHHLLITQTLTAESGLYEEYVALLTFFKDNHRTLLSMQAAQDDQGFSGKLMNNTFLFMYAEQGFLYPQISKKQNKLLYQYMFHGASAVIYEWLNDGMIDSVEDIATFLVDCSTSINEAILNKKSYTER